MKHDRPKCPHDSTIGSRPGRCADCDAENSAARLMGVVADIKAVKERAALRDQFAMAALAGILASGATDVSDMVGEVLGTTNGYDEARAAYRYADFMLIARETKGKS